MVHTYTYTLLTLKTYNDLFTFNHTDETFW